MEKTNFDEPNDTKKRKAPVMMGEEPIDLFCQHLPLTIRESNATRSSSPIAAAKQLR